MVRRRDVSFLDGYNVADRAVVNPFDRLAHARVGSPAEARSKAEVLLLGFLGGGHRYLHARRVDAVRFLAKDVLAGIDGGLQECRMEVRGNGNQHHVDAALDQVLVGVETDKGMIVVDRHLGGVRCLQSLAAALKMVGKKVGQGDQAHVLAGVHGVGRRPAASPAAADQANLDRVAASGVDAAGQPERAVDRRARHGRCLQEPPPRTTGAVRNAAVRFHHHRLQE